MKKILLIAAPGFEEIEALTVVNILRRAGAEVTLAGTKTGIITGRCFINIVADVFLNDISYENFHIIVLPGGLEGTKNLKSNPRVREILQYQNFHKKLIAAICAAPTVLSALGITKSKKVTSHPSVQQELTSEIYSQDRVVVDEHIITSRAPGTAIEFSFKLVEILYGKTKVEELNKGILALCH